MEKTKNCWVIQTDKPSRLSDCHDNKLHLDDVRYLRNFQNIYITSDEEIKENDWYWLEKINIIGSESGIYKSEDKKISKINTLTCNCKKIILTTDQDLIADGVQAIPDEFLEWFVENPNCEEVKIYHVGYVNVYNIIIPKEEQKQEIFRPYEEGQPIKVVRTGKTYNKGEHPYFKDHKIIEVIDNEGLIHDVFENELQTEEEPKQETLEETAEYYAHNWFDMHETNNYKALKQGFEAGAKWQQEQSKSLYSEEDLHNAFYNGWLYRGENYTFPKAKKEWFKQFKKK